MKRLVFLAPLSLLCAFPAIAGEHADGIVPFILPDAPNSYRSGSGLPGPAYWQNRADYRIAARIDTASGVLSGEETITYTNNSPDVLDVLWLQLDQNIYRADARAVFANPERHAHHTEGMVIDRAVIVTDAREVAVEPVVSDTRMRIGLPSGLPGHGGRIRLKLAWHYTIPGEWGGRTAITKVKDGTIYEIAQWYPRMSVYDDRRGWDTLPYLGQEFYLDYGDFDYAVTVPWNFTVVGSGALANPAEVLSFAASDAFVWDAARIDLPPLPPAPGLAPVPRLAMSVYPREGAGAQGWDRSTDYVKHAIEYFSAQWFPYPWPNAVNLGGHGAGMEYPGIVFDGWRDQGAKLFWITTHELGHGWFPMIVGSNERRNAFMDEGFNTFIDAYASEHFNHGEFAPKRDPEFAPKTGRPADDILSVLTNPAAPALMAPAETVPEAYRHSVTYFKAAYGLMLLREQILGPARFDPAFRRYIGAWAFKHPTPSDFFRLMSSEAGEDLDWFWRGWYFGQGVPGYAIQSVSVVGGETEVVVRNTGDLPLPVTLRVTFADGAWAERTIPTEAWVQHDRATVTLPNVRLPTRVELDPEHKLPEPDRSDDLWIPSAKAAGK
jgi:hypothetical protein